jgi:hypothetical protein
MAGSKLSMRTMLANNKIRVVVDDPGVILGRNQKTLRCG